MRTASVIAEEPAPAQNGYVRADRDIALAAMRAHYWRSEEAGWFEKPRRRLDWGHRWPTRGLPAL